MEAHTHRLERRPHRHRPVRRSRTERRANPDREHHARARSSAGEERRPIARAADGSGAHAAHTGGYTARLALVTLFWVPAAWGLVTGLLAIMQGPAASGLVRSAMSLAAMALLVALVITTDG